MSAERDVPRIVRSWLREEERDSADRVLEIVLSRLDSTPQRRSWWPARRSIQMNRLYQAALAVAAVLIVAVVGYNLLPGRGPSAGASPASPSPATTLGSTAAPSVPEVPPSGEIPTGRYAWSWPGGRLVTRIAPGWTSIQGGAALARYGGTQAEVTFDTWFPGSRNEFSQVYTDACGRDGYLAAVGPTVTDLITALDEQLSTDAVPFGRGGGPSTHFVTASGIPVDFIELVASEGLDINSCRVPAFQIFADPAETGFLALREGFSAKVWVLDVDGERIVFSSVVGPDATEAAWAGNLIDAMSIER
jgi:hypothetical protein